MDTLTNYLNTMFAVLPDTEDVRQAKAELLQMMEDRYTDLLSEGKSVNEAVGTVITEFGSIDEIAKALGLELPGKTNEHEAGRTNSRPEQAEINREDEASREAETSKEDKANREDEAEENGAGGTRAPHEDRDGWASFGNGILGVRDFARAITDWSRKKAAAVHPAGPEETLPLEAFTSIDCELDTAGLCIRPGDSFSLTIPEEMRTDLTCEVTGDTLTIREMPRAAIIIQDLKNENVLVTIPAEQAGKMEDFHLDISADDIALEGISASYVRAETAAGDVTLKNCSFALADIEASAGDIRISGGSWGRVTCDLSAGDLKTDGADFQTLDCNTSAGSILLHAIPDADLCAIKAEAELGRVMLFGKKQGGYFEADGSNGKELDLNATIGNIVID